MLPINAKYLLGQNNAIDQGRDLVIQTATPQLVGSLRSYPADKEELVTEELIKAYGRENIIKIPGYRLYICLIGTLTACDSSMPTPLETHRQVLAEMVAYYMANARTKKLKGYMEVDE